MEAQSRLPALEVCNEAHSGFCSICFWGMEFSKEIIFLKVIKSGKVMKCWMMTVVCIPSSVQRN